MANETKIIEIRVETTGDADIKRLSKALADLAKQQNATLKSTKELNVGMQSIGSTLKHAFALLGTGFTIKGLISSSKDLQELNDHIREVADSFVHATLQASGFLDFMNDPAKWEAIGALANKAAEYLGKGLENAYKQQRLLHPQLIIMEKFLEKTAQLEKQAADARQRRLMAVSRGEGTPPIEGVFVTASVNQGAREDRAAAEQAAREAQRLAEAQKKAQQAAYAQVDALRLQVGQQKELTDALGESEDKYDYIKKTQEDNAAIEKLLNDLRKAGVKDLDAQEKAIREMYASLRGSAEQQKMIKDMQKEQQDYAEENRKNLEATVEAIKSPIKETKKWMDELEAAGQVLAHTFVSVFTGGIHNARDFFREILKGLAEVAAQQAIMAALGNVASGEKKGAGILGFLGGLFAKGAAFDSGRVVPFAAGGIVTRPTIFPMASGAGLMGEAGPEAVMPLKRTTGGRLGVEVSGGAVTVINNLGVPALAKTQRRNDRLEIVLEAAQMGAQLAVADINRSVGSGYGSTAQSLQRSYGLRRRL